MNDEQRSLNTIENINDKYNVRNSYNEAINTGCIDS